MVKFSSYIKELHEAVQSSKVLITYHDMYALNKGDDSTNYKIVVKSVLDGLNIIFFYNFILIGGYKCNENTFTYIINEERDYHSILTNFNEDEAFQESLLDLNMLPYDEIKMVNNIIDNVTLLYRT